MPPARLTEGMAIIHTGLVAGVAPGADPRRLVVDHYGASAAYLVALGAGAAAALVAQTLPPPAAGARDAREPASRPAS